MEDKKYWLAGEMNIPENKKDELNEYVLKLLWKCGIRKTEKIQLAGKTLTVVKPAAVDEDGIVRFDYSVFEKKKREVGTYNTKTCELEVADRGYNEYGLVMNLIMTLQESYTNGNCYLMYKNKPVEYMRGYMRLLKSILGVTFELNSRARVKDMILFFRDNEEVKIDNLLDGIPRGYFNKQNLQLGRSAADYFEYDDLEEKDDSLLFYDVICRDDQDEFLEFWDGENLHLSKELKNYLVEWKEQFEKTDQVENFDMEAYLAEIICELDKDLGCRFVDSAFVEDFLMHGDEIVYQKALLMFREIMEKDLKFFPELTRRQAIDWFIKYNIKEDDLVVMSAYQSLLVNFEQRKKVLGF